MDDGEEEGDGKQDSPTEERVRVWSPQNLREQIEQAKLKRAFFIQPWNPELLSIRRAMEP